MRYGGGGGGGIGRDDMPKESRAPIMNILFRHEEPSI